MKPSYRYTTTRVPLRAVAFYDGTNAEEVADIIGHDRCLVAKTLWEALTGRSHLRVRTVAGERFLPVPRRRWILRERDGHVVVLEPHEFVLLVEHDD